jgi:hypothetical protein
VTIGIHRNFAWPRFDSFFILMQVCSIDGNPILVMSRKKTYQFSWLQSKTICKTPLYSWFGSFLKLRLITRATYMSTPKNVFFRKNTGGVANKTSGVSSKAVEFTS